MNSLSRAAGIVVPLSLSLTACLSRPQTARVQPEFVPVAASREQTLDAALAVFADRKIPLTVTDRKTGSLASDRVGVPADSALADCGVAGHAGDSRVLFPALAYFKAWVRGDSASSSLKVQVTWLSGTGMMVAECASKGLWESRFVSDVKARAEVASAP
jgi:hypothetical protein